PAQIVLAGTAHPQQVVGVGDVSPIRGAGRSRGVSRGHRDLLEGHRPRGRSRARAILPSGARTGELAWAGDPRRDAFRHRPDRLTPSRAPGSPTAPSPTSTEGSALIMSSAGPA